MTAVIGAGSGDRRRATVAPTLNGVTLPLASELRQRHTRFSSSEPCPRLMVSDVGAGLGDGGWPPTVTRQPPVGTLTGRSNSTTVSPVRLWLTVLSSGKLITTRGVAGSLAAVEKLPSSRSAGGTSRLPCRSSSSRSALRRTEYSVLASRAEGASSTATRPSPTSSPVSGMVWVWALTTASSKACPTDEGASDSLNTIAIGVVDAIWVPAGKNDCTVGAAGESQFESLGTVAAPSPRPPPPPPPPLPQLPL